MTHLLVLNSTFQWLIIDGIQRMIKINDDRGPGEDGVTSKAAIQINPAMNRHRESEIKFQE